MASGGSTRARAKKPPTILSVEAVLEQDDRKELVIDVPEWGGAVKIRALTKRAYTDIQKASTVDGQIDDLKFEMNLLLHGIAEPQFTEDQLGQLQEKSVGAIDRIVVEVMEISGLTTRAVAAFEAAFRDAA